MDFLIPLNERHWKAPQASGRVSLVRTLFGALLALCTLPSSCVGQDALAASPLSLSEILQARIRFQHLTSADGLSQDTVYAVLQDRKGFMWFATQGGLNRYDGAVVTQYLHNPRNPNSPSGDFLTDVLEDNRGIIWFSAPGLNKFDPATGQFSRYATPILRGAPGATTTSAGSTRLGTDSCGSQRMGGSSIDSIRKTRRLLPSISESTAQTSRKT